MAAMRAFLISIRAAADAALSLLDGVSSGRVHPSVQRLSSSGGQRVDNGVDSTGGQQVDSARSCSDISSSLLDSESLDSEEREKREARPPSVHPVRTAGGQQVDSAGGQHARNAALAGCWDGVGGVSTSGSSRARIGEIVPLLERLAAERGTDPVKLFQAACDRFKADAALKSKRMCTLPVLLSQLEQWVDDAPPPSSGAPAVAVPARRLLNPRPPAKEGSA